MKISEYGQFFRFTIRSCQVCLCIFRGYYYMKSFDFELKILFLKIFKFISFLCQGYLFKEYIIKIKDFLDRFDWIRSYDFFQFNNDIRCEG